ncbi:hypothetical protein BV20DRAFT_972457 [Pilatotrama ljubarskyi]|nr:hypothetical protein BV20DRAFT_972457 [Pilatotrama ljubarskyi]
MRALRSLFARYMLGARAAPTAWGLRIHALANEWLGEILQGWQMRFQSAYARVTGKSSYLLQPWPEAGRDGSRHHYTSDRVSWLLRMMAALECRGRTACLPALGVRCCPASTKGLP